MEIKAKLEKSQVRLRCKSCREFSDGGTICKKCGGVLRKITVWNLESKGIIINPITTEPDR